MFFKSVILFCKNLLFLIIDEDDNLNNSTAKEDPCKTLAATLGSIEVSEDSPLLRKNTSIPAIQTATSSDADLSPEDEMLSVK